jgi:hypothetical protein
MLKTPCAHLWVLMGRSCFMRTLSIVLSTFTVVALLVACQPEAGPGPEGTDGNPAPPIPTTVQLAVRPAGSPNAAPVYYSWRDLDGSGSNPATADTIVLHAGDVLSAQVFFLNQSTNPAEDITPALAVLAKELQLFFRFNCDGITFDDCHNDLNLLYSYADADGSGRYLGLLGTLTVPSAGGPAAFKTDHAPDAYTLRLALRYQPAPNGKATAPIPQGSILLGSSLLDATFPVRYNGSPR